MVSPLPTETKTQGGILLAERYAPEQQIYLVLAVGPGRKLKDGTHVPIPVDPGQKVLIDQYSIQSKADAGDNRFIINSSDVALVIG